jgi:ABC-type multidrug transport system fused ATPase/permease subunit
MPSHPAVGLNPLSNLLLTFVSPFLRAPEALWPLHPADDAHALTARLQAAWLAERAAAAAAAPPRAPRFVRAWAAAFLPAFALVGLAAWAKGLLALLQCRLVVALLRHLASGPAAALQEGLGYALAVGAVGAAAALADAYYWRSTWFHGHRWQCATVGLLHAKALRLRVDTLTAVSTGHAVSLATNDAERLQQLVHHLPHVLLAPLDTLIFAYFLVADLGGAAAGAGLGLMLAISAAQLCLYASAFGRLRRGRAGTTDARLTLTAQALAGMRVVKMNCWQAPLRAASAALRGEEVAQLAEQYSVRGTFEGLIHSKYMLLSAASIATLWALGQEITPARVYSASSLFYLLEMDRVWRAVENAETWTDAALSMARFEKFLLLPEVEPLQQAQAGSGSGSGSAAEQGAAAGGGQRQRQRAPPFCAAAPQCTTTMPALAPCPPPSRSCPWGWRWWACMRPGAAALAAALTAPAPAPAAPQCSVTSPSPCQRATSVP